MTLVRTSVVAVVSASVIAALVFAALLPTFINDSTVTLTFDFDQTTVPVGTGDLIDISGTAGVFIANTGSSS